MVATTTLASLLVSAFLVSALPHEAQHTFADDHHNGPINPLKRMFDRLIPMLSLGERMK